MMKKKNDVVLAYTNDSFRGPGKVAANLKKGLKLIGANAVSYAEAAKESADAYWGMLQTLPNEHMHLLLANTDLVVGPNLFVTPDEWPKAWAKKFQHYVVPSEWVKTLYRQYPILDNATIDVWPVGIDTEEWQPASAKKTEQRCLIYVKNRHEQDVELVKRILKKFSDQEYKILEYGKYTDSELKSSCNWATMGILLTDTESQGIAYMEMLSMNLPLFVFNKNWWNYDGKLQREVVASSVPYFDSRCGEVTEKVDLKLFEKFLHGVQSEKYTPRQYILENHTLEKSAEKYYALLELYQGKKAKDVK